MKMKYAILIDAAFLEKRIEIISSFSNKLDSKLFDKFIELIQTNKLANGFFLQRIYYYDGRPFGGKSKNPISNIEVNFYNSTFKAKKQLLEQIGEKDLVALRLGETKPRGWKVIKTYMKDSEVLDSSKIQADIMQKGVDMKIGLDLATLSIKKIVDRIILIAGDTDFIPAIKFARSEGIQVALCTLGNNAPTPLKEHVDILFDLDIVSIL